MPLGTSLSSDIQDASEEPGEAAAACAATWAKLMGAYFKGVQPPSTTVAAATTALQAQLAGAFASAPGAGIAALEAAFLAFAVQIGLGMAPAFVGAPPPSPVGFASLQATDDAGEAASALADLISTWASTGSATPSAGGPPVKWT